MTQEPVTRPVVEKLARLARLRLEGDEANRMAKELRAIVDYMSVLAEVELESTDAPFEEESLRVRQDEPEEGLEHDVALSQSA